jgi:hypothetical protein
MEQMQMLVNDLQNFTNILIRVAILLLKTSSKYVCFKHGIPPE